MLGKRFRICSLAGIPIEIDPSWFIIAFLLTWTLAAGHFPYLYPGLPSNAYWIMGLVGMLGLFVCILLHEFGHALVAKHYKVPVARITLFIFGGIAELKKEPQSPLAEFLVAIAGPLVSAALALLFYIIGQSTELYGLPVAVTAVAYYLALINSLIVIFNLVPAFPLDGGRILRSILWGWKKDLGWATKITTGLGAGFGLFLFFFGIFNLFSHNVLTGIWLIILGLFLQRTAVQSRTQFYVGKELKGEKVKAFMKTDIDGVSPDITVKDLIDHHVYQSRHHIYPVTTEGRLLGYVTIQDVKAIAHENRDLTFVNKLMQPLSKEFIVSPETDAFEALSKIGEAPFPILFVLDREHLVGLLTAQDLLKLVSLKLELEGMQKY